MPTPHGRLYWLIVAVAATVGIVLLATILASVVRRSGHTEAQLRATQDSLVALRTQTADAIRQMRARDTILAQANRSLDSLLAVPPRVIYRQRSTPNAPAVLLGDTLRPDLPSGDTVEALVPLPAYEALATGCRASRSACDSAQAAKDSVIALQQAQLATQGSIIAQQETRRRRERWAERLGRVRDWGLGAMGGAVVCAVWCR